MTGDELRDHLRETLDAKAIGELVESMAGHIAT